MLKKFIKTKKENQKRVQTNNNEKLHFTDEELSIKKIAIDKLKQKITVLEHDSENKRSELAKNYENMGLLYYEIGEIDFSMKALEKSLDYELSIKEGYKKLLHIYNEKRQAAAYAKDNEEIQKWLDKMEELRKIAKKATLGIKY